jgi:hypothetical protein
MMHCKKHVRPDLPTDDLRRLARLLGEAEARGKRYRFTKRKPKLTAGKSRQKFFADPP